MLSFFRSKRPLIALSGAVHSDVPSLQSAEMAAIYYGRRIGGDLYDFIRVSPNRVLFGLLDVAGLVEENHPIVAAAKASFRSAGAELLADDDINEADALIEITHRVNRAILQTAGGVRSSPAFLGCYNETLGTVSYVNAGHIPGLLQDNEGIEELPATGLPLGLFSHSTPDASILALEPGARMLLVSRGIVEAKCRDEEFGLPGVELILNRGVRESAKDLCMTVMVKLEEFLCRPPSENDVTALALVKQPSASA